MAWLAARSSGRGGRALPDREHVAKAAGVVRTWLDLALRHRGDPAHACGRMSVNARLPCRTGM